MSKAFSSEVDAGSRKENASKQKSDYDVAVVGGGLLGSAIAWGLGRLGKRVAVLDEGDITKRASRANFALVWVQSKGLGMPAYTVWTGIGAVGAFIVGVLV